MNDANSSEAREAEERLLPVEGPSAEELARDPRPAAPLSAPPEEHPTFTLRDVFLAITVVAVGLALARFAPPAWLALVVGITTVVVLLGFPLFGGEERIKVLAALILLALYASLALAAVLAPPPPKESEPEPDVVIEGAPPPPAIEVLDP